MGFLDKAKKLAEQAQSKLDEVQSQINTQGSPKPPPGQHVEYDKHGRPIPPQPSATPPTGPGGPGMQHGSAIPSAGPPMSSHGDPLAGAAMPQAGDPLGGAPAPGYGSAPPTAPMVSAPPASSHGDPLGAAAIPGAGAPATPAAGPPASSQGDPLGGAAIPAAGPPASSHGDPLGGAAIPAAGPPASSHGDPLGGAAMPGAGAPASLAGGAMPDAGPAGWSAPAPPPSSPSGWGPPGGQSAPPPPGGGWGPPGGQSAPPSPPSPPSPPRAAVRRSGAGSEPAVAAARGIRCAAARVAAGHRVRGTAARVAAARRVRRTAARLAAACAVGPAARARRPADRAALRPAGPDRGRGRTAARAGVARWRRGSQPAELRAAEAHRRGPARGLTGPRAILSDMRPYEGLLTAMITPFRADGSVDEENAVAIGRHLLANGSHGLVVAGTTGEAATMTDEEHLGLIELIVRELGGEGVVIGGTGSNDTRHAIHLTEKAVEAGVDAVLSVTPYYNKPNRRGILAHFKAVAEAAAGTPVVLYNIPGRTATNMSPELLSELAQIDGIEACKQANSDELQLIDGLAMLAGNDDIYAKCLDIGGVGGICVASHVVGPEMRRIYDEPDARAELDAALQDIYAAMFVTASPAPVKAALEMLGHDPGTLRLPLVACDETERTHVHNALAQHGLLAGASAR